MVYRIRTCGIRRLGCYITACWVVYHHMRGSLEGCQDVISTGGDIPTTLSDISKGAREMHRLGSDVWRVLHPRQR
jgi:hypothetical protein